MNTDHVEAFLNLFVEPARIELRRSTCWLRSRTAVNLLVLPPQEQTIATTIPLTALEPCRASITPVIR